MLVANITSERAVFENFLTQGSSQKHFIVFRESMLAWLSLTLKPQPVKPFRDFVGRRSALSAQRATSPAAYGRHSPPSGQHRSRLMVVYRCPASRGPYEAHVVQLVVCGVVLVSTVGTHSLIAGSWLTLPRFHASVALCGRPDG